jgi:hypothetical protein
MHKDEIPTAGFEPAISSSFAMTAASQRQGDRMQARVARFFLLQHTKTGKICQMIDKYTKWP